jgi:MscS family membrane protein
MTLRAIELLASTDRRAFAVGKLARRLGAALLLSLVATIAWGQSPEHPLKPPDRSSPRAALKTFLDSTDAVADFLAHEYLPSPSRANFDRVIELSAIPVESLDTSALPPAARLERSRAAALSLYEVLSRIELPPFDEIPEAEELASPAGGDPPRWVIPDTEIALVRVQSGPRTGQFLFSADTVDKAEIFSQRVSNLPYTRPVAIEGVKELLVSRGGWMVPFDWVLAMPAWLRTPVANQALWKWIAFALVLVGSMLFLWMANRLSQLGRGRSPLLHALAQLTLPVAFLAATPAVAYLAVVQVNLTGEEGIAVAVAATVITVLAGAWLSWRLAPVVAEAIITSPRIGPASIDAHLIRVSTRLLGIMGSATFLALGAAQLGIPVYGVIAGLGVGGLAIALAAQPTIENLIGGLNLFADKPIRVGDFCRYGSDIGTVEAIGIRSTRVRGIDRTVTTIPNAALARMPIVNYTWRDRMLIQTVIGLRYETTPEQLRYVLVRLREMLLGHPRVHPDPARARLIGFGASSLDIEVFAYAMTSDWAEFLGIQEDVLLRVMDIIEQAGTAIAFPSQTLYLGRDQGPDDPMVEAAEAAVRAWRADGSLPFPNFSPEQARELRGSVVFPPPGSVAAPGGRHAEQTNRAGDARQERDAARRGGEAPR